mmetsp:Transcript_10286/g.21145  ORF Transcript_10286/g.21145 Transcript_10286/m.21145 type:complete len:228 (+) Transcript_10286:43-726(+)
MNSRTPFFALIISLLLNISTGYLPTTSIISTGRTKSQALRSQRRAGPFVVRGDRTALNGLFDGMKEAFSAPALEKSYLDSERETPIDRWMGWNVDSNKEVADDTEFVDSMDESNYISVALPKPMGIVFEENDVISTLSPGGVYVFELAPEGVAMKDGTIQFGDQLVGVCGSSDKKVVFGKDFDEAIGAIKESGDEKVTLVCFRGPVKDLYGPTKPSMEWLTEFIQKH